MTLGLRLRVALACRVCGQAPEDDEPDATIVSVALWGAVAYAQCPACRQEVEDHHDRNYRARVRRYVRRMQHGKG